MEKKDLELLQRLPLDIKVAKTKLRIQEWVKAYGIDGVFVSFSGGKDSTVLLHIAREIYPDIKAVYVDTGLEYPEVKQFVRTVDNVETIKPKKSFKQVIEEYGYPVISKEQAEYIREAREGTEKVRNLRINGNAKGQFKISKKWMFMLDAPFKISDRCCHVMKKYPSKHYEKVTGRHPIVGSMASESILRQTKYLQEGCNAFNNKRPMSMPMGFWTEQDVLQYIYENNIQIPSVYGHVLKDGNTYKNTGVDRTGCVFCLFGIHLEKGYNRVQRLQVTHPQLHTYILDKLGYREVMEYMGIPHTIPEAELPAAKEQILNGLTCTSCDKCSKGIQIAFDLEEKKDE